MQNPKQEIKDIIVRLTSTQSPEQLEETINKYFVVDAAFRHPMCAVEPGPESRKAILGIYQWYRIMSPNTKSNVLSAVYDKDLNVLIVEIVQYFHIRYSPLQPRPSRLMTRLVLKNIGGKEYISMQEDFYHTDDFMNLLVPPLTPLVKLALSAATFVSALSAAICWPLGMGSKGKEKQK